jgi:hypothetical protein
MTSSRHFTAPDTLIEGFVNRFLTSPPERPEVKTSSEGDAK